MRTTIDSGGRIVVPKRMRDFLGLVAGSEVEIDFDGPAGLRLEAVPRRTELKTVDGVLVVKSRGEGEPITGDAIREILEATRDRRL